MLSQGADEVAFDVLLQGMLIMPFPIGNDLLVEGVLNTDPFPPLRGLKVLHHFRPADVKFVELTINVGHIQQRRLRKVSSRDLNSTGSYDSDRLFDFRAQVGSNPGARSDVAHRVSARSQWEAKIGLEPAQKVCLDPTMRASNPFQ